MGPKIQEIMSAQERIIDAQREVIKDLLWLVENHTGVKDWELAPIQEKIQDMEGGGNVGRIS